MKFIELTLYYYSNKKILVNLDSVSRIVPESDGGCKIWFLYPGSNTENGCRVKEDYEKVKKLLDCMVLNVVDWQPWHYSVTESTPVVSHKLEE